MTEEEKIFERIKDMQQCIDRADVFITDVLPQIRSIVVQDYSNLNELCMALTRLRTKEEDDHG